MNIGLVLSGGMAKGAYEVGALKAISEYLQPSQIKYVSSSSIGALNSAAFSCGRLDDSYNMWRGITQYNDKLFIKTVLGSCYLKNSIKELSSGQFLCEKLYIPLFHLKSRNNYYIDLVNQDKSLLEAYLNAAIAVFPICNPVLVNGKYYYDGALIDNIPVYPLLKHNLDYIICIYFDKNNYLFESRYFDNKVIKITFYDEKEVLKKSIWFEKESIENMLNFGYSKAKSILDFVFMKGTDDLQEIYSKIEELNSLNMNKQIRLTGDIAINNLNKVAQRITNRKFIE